MIFTTRDPREAERFVNKLPFTDEEKTQIKSFFNTTEELMHQMKKSKSFNSKGGERWFAARLQSRAMDKINSMVLSPELTDMDVMKTQFLAGQIGCSEATMEIAKECECDESLTHDLQRYVDFLNQLFEKYTSGDACPACGSTNIANEGPEDEYSCHDCSYQWSE